MGRSVQLPEFADLGALPAAHWSVGSFGWSGMGQAILKGPVADLSAVEFEGMQAQGFGGGEAVGARRGAGQAFSEEVGDGLWPSGGVVATRDSREPRIGFVSRASSEVISAEGIKATTGDTELVGRLGGRQGVFSEGGQHVPDEGGCVPMR